MCLRPAPFWALPRTNRGHCHAPLTTTEPPTGPVADRSINCGAALLAALIEDGKLTPVVDRTYPLANTAEGSEPRGAGARRGKVVVTVA